MQAIIIFKESLNREIAESGIYTDISYKALINEYGIKESDILFYIPLTVSGRNYKERQADLENKAIEYSHSWYDFCNWSYGELADIQSFFETNGRRYGLLRTFRNEAIC